MRVVAFRAVIGEEQDEGILVFARIFQVPEQPADILIQRLDHRGVELHAAHFKFLLLLVQFLPARPFRMLRRGYLSCSDQAGCLHSFDAFLTDPVITDVIDTLVPVDIFLRRL